MARKRRSEAQVNHVKRLNKRNADDLARRRGVDGVLYNLLNDSDGPLRADILSRLNRTEYTNLRLVSRAINRQLTKGRAPILIDFCEARKLQRFQANGPGNGLGPLGIGPSIAPSAQCSVFSRGNPTITLRPCEGPTRFGTARHRPTMEICGNCALDAVHFLDPLVQSMAITPLCKQCSLTDLANHPNPRGWMCRCVSHYSSAKILARLCYECRIVLESHHRASLPGLLRQKVPVLDATIPDANNDPRRWRRIDPRLLGAWQVGCRGCQMGWRQLQQSYMVDPFGGPNWPRNHARYENYLDMHWSYNGQNSMVFKCLVCDQNVGWHSVAHRSLGRPMV